MRALIGFLALQLTFTSFAAFAVFGFAGTAQADAIPVEIIETDAGGWQLVRGGEPYFIKGPASCFGPRQ